MRCSPAGVPSLVKTIAREESTSKGDEGYKTGRYDEAALAFDDEGVMDGPTFETYSLPSDAAILATLPIDGAIEVAMPVASAAARPPGYDSGPPLPPPATAETIRATDPPTSLPPTERPRKIRSRRTWIAAMALLMLAVVCAIAAHVAK